MLKQRAVAENRTSLIPETLREMQDEGHQGLLDQRAAKRQAAEERKARRRSLESCELPDFNQRLQVHSRGASDGADMLFGSVLTLPVSVTGGQCSRPPPWSGPSAAAERGALLQPGMQSLPRGQLTTANRGHG